MQDSQLLLITMVFLLGVRHGFDLDHIATIDGITRMVSANRLLAKMIGCLFSLGHGFVIILISLIIGSGFKLTHTPQWLDGVGTGISIIFLLVFGLLNLWNVFQSPSKSPLPTSLKDYLTVLGEMRSCFAICFAVKPFTVYSRHSISRGVNKTSPRFRGSFCCEVFWGSNCNSVN